MKKRKTNVWIKIFSEKKIPFSNINNIKEVLKNKQIKERKMILNYNFDKIKDLKISGNPLKFSFLNINDQPKRSPDLNENRLEILKKFK